MLVKLIRYLSLIIQPFINLYNLVTTHTSYSNGEVNKRKLLVLNNISYNDDFANKFLEKINQLEENQKNNLGKLIMNAIEIKHNVR